MPFICMARNDIPDGTLQVLDLWPNTSLRNQSIDPPGQTRYINRTPRGAITTSVAGVVSGGAGNRAADGQLRGLEAYLCDRVEPGTAEQAGQVITFSASEPGTTIAIGGVLFTGVTAAPGPNPALQEFLADPADDAASAASFIAAVLDPASIGLMQAAAPFSVIATAAPGPNPEDVALVAELNDGVNPVVPHLGPEGDLLVDIIPAAATDLTSTVDDIPRLFRQNSLWSEAALIATADAIQARVDAGQALAAADIKTIVDAQAGTDLTGPIDNSTITVADVLSILSGRSYALPVGTTKFNDGVWDNTQFGAFTEAVLVNDTQMLGGELRPVTAGGDTVNVETKPIRYTVDSDAMQISLQSGSLSRMQDGTVDLFVESIYSAFKPGQPSQPGPKTAAVAGARLVTVYDNDGSLL